LWAWGGREKRREGVLCVRVGVCSNSKRNYIQCIIVSNVEWYTSMYIDKSDP
jgi:hypothetical protein